MIAMDWGKGAFALLLVAAIVSLCVGIYARLLASVRAGRGKEWSAPLGLPDLLVSGVLASWLGAMAVSGFLRAEPATPLTARALVDSAALFVAIVGVISVFLQARQIPVSRLFGLRPANLLSLLKRGLGLFIASLPLVLFCVGVVHLVVGQEMEMQEIAKYILDAARHADWSRLTSLLFAAIHMNGPVFLPLFVLAVCLTLAYEATGSLWVPMLMHALFNGVMIGMMFYTAQHP